MGLPGGAGLPDPQGCLPGCFPGWLKILLARQSTLIQTTKPGIDRAAIILPRFCHFYFYRKRCQRDRAKKLSHWISTGVLRCCSVLVKESIVGDGDGDGGDDDDGDGGDDDDVDVDGDGVESIMMMMQVPEVERGGWC